MSQGLGFELENHVEVSAAQERNGVEFSYEPSVGVFGDAVSSNGRFGHRDKGIREISCSHNTSLASKFCVKAHLITTMINQTIMKNV